MNVVVVVGILGTASGLPFPTAKGAAEKIEQAFRGLRASYQNVYCDSIDCPDGFTPIANADAVKCWGNTCESSQCCEASWSYHPCPIDFFSVEDAENILFDNGGGCTIYMCCQNGRK